LILLAAITIAASATDRLLDPQPLSDVAIGLAVAGCASLINLDVGLMLVRAGREHRSITLEADGRHLLTDVWTSVGVIVGVALVAITGWERLDPIVALAVAANILLTRRTTSSSRWRHSGLAGPSFTRSEHDARGNGRSSHCTSSSRATGPSSAGTISQRRSRQRFVTGCRMRPCSRTSSPSRTLGRSRTQGSTGNRRRQNDPTSRRCCLEAGARQSRIGFEEFRDAPAQRFVGARGDRELQRGLLRRPPWQRGAALGGLGGSPAASMSPRFGSSTRRAHRTGRRPVLRVDLLW
jgi:hypothetical protein